MSSPTTFSIVEKTKQFLLIGILLGFGGSNLALAQSPLSLAGAVELALANHEDAEIALLRLKQAEARERQVLSRLFPQLGVNASLAYLPSSETQVGELAVVQSESKTVVSGQADLTIDLVNLSAIVDYLAAPDRTKAQRLATDEARRNLAFVVARQFMMVLAAEQVQVAAKNRLEVASLTVNQAQKRFDAGVGRASDVTRAELERASAQSTQISSTRDVLLEGLSLMKLLALPDKQGEIRKLQPPGESLVDFDWNTEAVTNFALDTRLDLQQARLVADTTLEAIRQNLAGYLPVISAGATISKRDDGVVERDGQWSVGVNMRWDLFSGGYRSAQDELLRAEARVAELVAAQLSRVIPHEVDVAKRRLEASLQEVRQAKVQATLAEKNGRQTAAMFKHGLATALEQVDAIANTYLAQANLVGRKFAVRLAELSLLQATGRWPTGGTGP